MNPVTCKSWLKSLWWMIPAPQWSVPGQTLGGHLQPTYITNKYKKSSVVFFCDGTQQYGIPALCCYTTIWHTSTFTDSETLHKYYKFRTQENTANFCIIPTILSHYETRISTNLFPVKHNYLFHYYFNNTFHPNMPSSDLTFIGPCIIILFL